MLLKKRVKTQIIRASKDDISSLKKIMANAFFNDPFTNFLVKPDELKHQRLEIIFETMMSAFGFRGGHVYTTKDKKACLIGILPNNYNPNSIFNLLLFPKWVKVVGWSRLSKVMQGSSYLEKHHAGKKYFYIMAFGVDPSIQGQGVASEVLEDVLKYCDENKFPACLETSNERNLNLYLKHGFTIKEQIIIPNGGPVTWIMTREI